MELIRINCGKMVIWLIQQPPAEVITGHGHGSFPFG